MSTRRKRTAAGIQQAPNNIPPYYFYPQYGYMPPPVYNPEYMYPIPSYQNSEYIYYPVNQNGEIIGPPTNFPPIVNQHYQESYPYPDYIPNVPTHGSFIHSPRRDRTLHEDSYYHHHPHSHRSHEKSRHETLPPINKHPFVSPRLVLPDDAGYQQFAVRDLTERSLTSSNLSNRNAIQNIKHDEKLRRSYH